MQQKMGCFAFLWSVIWNWIQNSQVYRILRGIYDKIAGGWQKSRIAGWFRVEHYGEDSVRRSLAGRILGAPFTFLTFVQRRWGEKLARGIEKSVALGLGRCYLHHWMAMDLSFLGYLLLGCGLGCFLGTLIVGAGSPLWLVVAGVGFVLSLIRGNLTDWLAHSRLIGFICTCLGIQPNYQWYRQEETEKKGSFLPAAGFGLLCGLAGGMTHPVLGLLMMPAAAFLFLILERPVAGVYFLVFLAPLAPTMALVALSLYTIFALVIKSLIQPSFRWRFDGMGLLLMAFIVIYFLAALTSFARGKSLAIWAVYLAFMATYFLIIHLIRSRKDLHRLLVTFVLSGLAVCLYGIAQYVFGWDTAQAWMDEEMFSDIKMRIYSTLGNPNVLGEYILLVLPAAIGLFWTGKGFWQKATYLGITGVLFVALILTFSRGCWVGLLFAAAIFITFAAGKLWGLGLVALPVLPALLPESIINRFTSIGDMKDSSTSYRVYIWMGTLAMIRDFWVSGIGMGAEAFTQVYPFYSYSGIVAPHSHNLFLQILVESGIVGIVIFGLILLLFIKKMVVGYQWGGGKGAPLSTMITALSAGIGGFLLQGMFDNCFYNYRVMLVFWMVLAMAMACTTVAKGFSRGEATT